MNYFLTDKFGNPAWKRSFKTMGGAIRKRQNLKDLANTQPGMQIHRINSDGAEERFWGYDGNREEWGEYHRTTVLKVEQ